MLSAANMDGSAVKPQPRSADAIRVDKIDIEGSQKAVEQQQEGNGRVHDGPIEGQPPSSCLGDVVPTYEPLKACLEDDSSIEGSDDEFDDDDFFFGDDMDIDSMAVEYFNKNNSATATATAAASRRTSPAVAPLPPIPASTSAPSLAAVSDEGSSLSSLATDNTSSASLRGFHSYSTGALSSQNSLSSSMSGKRKSKRRVSIHNDVAVVAIPSRAEYDDRIKERLWSSGAELYQNAARNTIEFAAEGWNWRNVTEDENMLVHTHSGELIHPIHLQNALQMNAVSEAAASKLPVVPNVANAGVAAASPSQVASA